MRLFEIRDRIEAIILEATDRETGEIDPAAFGEIAELEGAAQEKGLDLLAMAKGEDAEAKAIKEQAELLIGRSKIHARRAQSLRNIVKLALPEGEKWEDARACAQWVASPGSVEVADERWTGGDLIEHVDPDYVRQRVTYAVDKSAALSDLRDGKEIKGLRLRKDPIFRVS